MRWSSFVIVLVTWGGIGGCAGGSSEPPQTPSKVAASDASAPEVDAGGASAPPPSVAAPARRKPFEIHNGCTDVATVVFGEDPKAPGVDQRKLAPSSSLDGPRDADGNQLVWLLDPNGEPLVKVRVTRGMKRVEIGRSCRTLDAR